jgi:cyclopropane fatty-acyl-phospholipid synthase-like methyltransferase
MKAVVDPTKLRTIRELYGVMQSSPMNEWVGAGNIEQVAKTNLANTIENTNLAETDKVLDFGCGIGRTTVPIAEYVKCGEVVGIDIVHSMIEFCNLKIAPVLPNTRFFVLSDSNPLYDGRNEDSADLNGARDIVVSLEQLEARYRGYFDTIVAYSVFTHFNPEMAARYLKFFHAVTKPSAVVLLTAFIDTPTNKYRLRASDKGYRDCLQNGVPLRYNLFGFDRFNALTADAGFRISRLNLGIRDVNMPHRVQRGIHGHDSIVLTKIPVLPDNFDDEVYLNGNPTLVKSGVNPRRHYLNAGYFEGRPTRPSERSMVISQPVKINKPSLRADEVISKPANVRSAGMGFFTDYSIYGTDAHAANRLNTRYDHIVRPNLRYIVGKRILDLGAYDGRWMWAYLQSGAVHVTGIEGRASSAARLLSQIKKGFPDHYKMIVGDAFDVLPTFEPGQFDTIMCLGFFYHILNHERLISLMRRLEPEAIVIDSGLVDTEDMLMRFRIERTDHPMNGISEGEETAVGVLSRGAVAAIAKLHGYSVRYIEWKASEIPDHHEIADYLGRNRFTCVLEPAGRFGKQDD